MIEALIRRARRRYIGNELLAHAAYAASAAMAGLILLLIAGTQILDWSVLVLLSAGALAIGMYRTFRRLPSPYAIAQLVDRRCYLADALSTALFFAGSQSKGMESMRAGQRSYAERVAETADLERAIPFAMPRAAYVLAAFGLVASGLFALRYGVTHRLDLRPPLARIVMENFGFGAERQEQAKLPKTAASRPDMKPVGLTMPDGDPNNPSQLDPAPDSALDTIGVPDAVNDSLRENQRSGKAKSEGASTEKSDGEPGDAASSESADPNSGESLSDNSQSGQNGKQNGTPNGGKPEEGNAGQNSSLVSKLRDAMSNLLSKMRQPNGSGSQNQSNSGQNGQQQAAAQRAGQRQNGASGQGQQQGAGQESADAENQQTGAEGKNGQNSQAKGGGQSSDQQASNQPGSGIGRQDGNKDSKLAEQLAAMGKISEIIGKRSANVTGEITIEVPSSQQQLKTPYSQTSVVHADSGGEISRDEVPVIFQQYVQQYFEQIRKQPARRPEPTARSKAQTPAAKTPPPSM
jgi:hypothetical protein